MHKLICDYLSLKLLPFTAHSHSMNIKQRNPQAYVVGMEWNGMGWIDYKVQRLYKLCMDYVNKINSYLTITRFSKLMSDDFPGLTNYVFFWQYLK